MLKDAKVSGEILLQLLNNILDTAKLSAGRLEVSRDYHKVREFLERAWVICGEIIRKKDLYGRLSVNIDVPDILEYDGHRMMQILINLISNAAKFTDKGEVKMYVDFVECDHIQTELMKPKHTRFAESLASEDQSAYSEVIHTEELDESPINEFEHLTISKKLFDFDRGKFINHYKNAIEFPSMLIGTGSKRFNEVEVCSNKKGFIE